jgi:hypothetical protein
VKPYTVDGRVFPALRENFDTMSVLVQIDVNLTAFAIIFPLQAKK